MCGGGGVRHREWALLGHHCVCRRLTFGMPALVLVYEIKKKACFLLLSSDNLFPAVFFPLLILPKDGLEQNSSPRSPFWFQQLSHLWRRGEFQLVCLHPSRSSSEWYGKPEKQILLYKNFLPTLETGLFFFNVKVPANQ